MSVSHKVKVQINVSNGKRKKIIIDGIQYNSLREMYDATGIKECDVKNAMKRFGMTQANAIVYALDHIPDYRNPALWKSEIR